MSVWTDRILQEFPADLSSFWIALDPDGLLLDESILHGLRERGFEVLPFEDSVSFRTEYEERYRAAWDTPMPTMRIGLSFFILGIAILVIQAF